MDHCTDLFIPKINIINLKLDCIFLDGFEFKFFLSMKCHRMKFETCNILASSFIEALINKSKKKTTAISFRSPVS